MHVTLHPQLCLDEQLCRARASTTLAVVFPVAVQPGFIRSASQPE